MQSVLVMSPGTKLHEEHPASQGVHKLFEFKANPPLHKVQKVLLVQVLQFSGQFLMQFPVESKVKPLKHWVHLGVEHDGQVSKQFALSQFTVCPSSTQVSGQTSSHKLHPGGHLIHFLSSFKRKPGLHTAQSYIDAQILQLTAH
jgi:hypothetical protein